MKAILLAGALAALAACTHIDDLDADGCHSRGGTYHCHRGPCEGARFKTKNDYDPSCRNRISMRGEHGWYSPTSTV